MSASKRASGCPRRATSLAAFLAALSTLGGACSLPRWGQPASEATSTPADDRFRRAYADLSSGRFTVIADFNSADQLARVAVEPAADPADPPGITGERSRSETGSAALRVKLTPGATVGFRSDAAGSTLPRDWRPYSILLTSVYASERELPLVVELDGSSGRAWSRLLRVRPGWNLLRVDVHAALAELDSPEIRSFRFRLPDDQPQTVLFFDDVILADNTRFRLGEDAGEGRLFAKEQGRRIVVGARGAFEATFENGVLSGWSVGAGPNLAAPSGLGPWVAPLDPDWWSRDEPPAIDDPSLFADWGASASTFQEVVEASPFRVVVRGVWRFGAAPPGGVEQESAPRHDWQYVIYASGDVYVRLSSSTAGRGWAASRVGCAVLLDARRGFRRAPSQRGYGELDPVRFALWTQSGDAPDLLWTPHAPEDCARQLELESDDGTVLAMICGDEAAADTVESAHRLTLASGALDWASAEAASADYQHPAGVRVELGELRTNQPGDLNGDGFNESEGLYEVALDGDSLRMTLSAGRWTRHEPMVRVHGTTGRACWAYSDGRILRGLGRDRSGALLVRIPRLVADEVRLEVIGRAP